MIYISPSDEAKIQRRIKRLPQYLRGQKATILTFQIVSTLLLTYGICISIFKHPIKQRKPDPSCQIYIGCFCYFALSVAAPFTGSHMNPAITIFFNRLKKNNFIFTYMISQFIGALIGALLALWFFNVIPAPYNKDESFLSCLLDTFSQIFGTMLFVIIILYVNKLKYSSGQYFGYLIVSIGLIVSRAFTFRRSCLNPTMGSIFQIIFAIKQQNYFLIVYCLPIIIGPIIGAILGSILFQRFYKPLYDQIRQIKEIKQNQV